jgi:hypothetical protein
MMIIGDKDDGYGMNGSRNEEDNGAIDVQVRLDIRRVKTCNKYGNGRGPRLNST